MLRFLQERNCQYECLDVLLSQSLMRASNPHMAQDLEVEVDVALAGLQSSSHSKPSSVGAQNSPL
jgi:hypothetical protein